MSAKKSNTQIDGYNKTFPRILRELIEKNNTTIQAVANQIGITRQAVSQYCNGETQPNGETLLKIADCFGVSCDYLLRGVSAENINIKKELGLSDKAIEILKVIVRMDSLESTQEISCSKLISDIIESLESKKAYLELLNIADLRFKSNVQAENQVYTVKDLGNKLKMAGICDSNTVSILIHAIDATGFKIISPYESIRREMKESLDYLNSLIFATILRESAYAMLLHHVIQNRDSSESITPSLKQEVIFDQETIFDMEKREGACHADDNKAE